MKIAINTGGGDAPGLNAFVPLAEAVARTCLVPPDGDGVLTARTLGISFGD